MVSFIHTYICIFMCTYIRTYIHFYFRGMCVGLMAAEQWVVVVVGIAGYAELCMPPTLYGWSV